jgi:integrase/recombinase XerD
MLERYFIRPTTVDRIRTSWIAKPIEQYVASLADHGYAARNVFRRVPVLVQFGDFARRRGATRIEELPAHIDAFAERWAEQHGTRCTTTVARKKVAGEARNPVEQMLRLAMPEFCGRRRARWARGAPFDGRAGRFFDYLTEERGLRQPTVDQYWHHLGSFDAYLKRIACDVAAISPPILGAFIAESASHIGTTGVRSRCGVLRVFLRYLYRERLIPKDLSACVEMSRSYRLSGVPRSISWDDVRRMLDAVDRRTPVGRRDYAILVLLVTYGLRGREVAAMTLDDIDWKRERLRVPERKAGHSTGYPLSPTVGAALLDYLQHGRPETTDRRIFLRVLAPQGPYTWSAISSRVAHYLHRAGINVPRAGSRTLRHTCVQRLVDADFPFKVIGDYVGHRTPESTDIYAKVAVEVLREVAIGDGEKISKTFKGIVLGGTGNVFEVDACDLPDDSVRWGSTCVKLVLDSGPSRVVLYFDEKYRTTLAKYQKDQSVTFTDCTANSVNDWGFGPMATCDMR